MKVVDDALDLAQEVKRRLTSRKFWMAVAAFLGAFARDNVWAAAIVAVIYVLVEGAVDVARTRSGSLPTPGPQEDTQV